MLKNLAALRKDYSLLRLGVVQGILLKAGLAMFFTTYAKGLENLILA
jgi:hypothetical protein